MFYLKSRRLALFAVLLAALLLAACAQPVPTAEPAAPAEEEAAPSEEEPMEESAAEPAELTHVTLRLPWIINAQFAGPYMALEKGYFEDEGLDVEIRPGGFDINSITLVASGEDTFGLHDTGSLILARSNEIPVVAAATFFQKHPGGLMALKESGIETLEDIEGKTIGFQEGGPWMLSKAMLEANGIDLDTINQTTVGFDLSPLFSGQIDLMTVYVTNEPLIAQAQGYETTVFLPYDYGIETSSEALFTTDEYLDAHPDVVCGMVRAIRRGWEEAIANQEEAVDIIMAAGGEELNRDAELAQLAANEDHLLTPDSIEHGIGYMTEERWQIAEDVLSEYGQLENDVDVNDVFTLQCLEE
jgi:NitT/TauT family transport system substrate-binding protein